LNFVLFAVAAPPGVSPTGMLNGYSVYFENTGNGGNSKLVSFNWQPEIQNT